MEASNFQESIDNYLMTPNFGMNKERAIGIDWQGNQFMHSQPIYRKDGLFIPEDSLNEFNQEEMRKMTAKEKLSRIIDLISYSVKEDVENIQMINSLLEDILTDKILSIGIPEYYDLIYSETEEE